MWCVVYAMYAQKLAQRPIPHPRRQNNKHSQISNEIAPNQDWRFVSVCATPNALRQWVSIRIKGQTYVCSVQSVWCSQETASPPLGIQCTPFCFKSIWCKRTALIINWKMRETSVELEFWVPRTWKKKKQRKEKKSNYIFPFSENGKMCNVHVFYSYKIRLPL